MTLASSYLYFGVMPIYCWLKKMIFLPQNGDIINIDVNVFLNVSSISYNRAYAKLIYLAQSRILMTCSLL
jgi:hypothetical protein